jgi:adenylate cyclase
MNEEHIRRKLSAILSADVAGYSRLMADDEEATVRTITSYREFVTNVIQTQNGRVADAKGDNILAEFVSVVDAVRCGAEIQRKLKERNAELPDHRKMEFRLGINIGDIIEDEETIYGDGVNIAARLEGLSHPGGLCISGTAYDHVKNKLNLGYEYIGEQTVKNIPEPVRVYRVLIDPEAAGKVIGEKPLFGKMSRRAAMAAIVILTLIAGGLGWNLYLRQSKRVEPVSLDNMAYPLPDKPSIAVLPFDNLSGDPKQEPLADGISESIITAISYIPDMFVIARNSTFTYKGKPVKVRQVAEELGVRYVLEGSVLKAVDRIRVTAQLIDATTGYHVWSRSYDRAISDLFALLDDVTKAIAIELQVQISDKVAHLSGKTNNLEAWASATEAYSLVSRLGKENIARARVLTEKAVNLDPKYGYAWAILAAAHYWDAALGYSPSKAESFKKAVEFNSKALELDDTLSCAMALQALIYRAQGKLEEAIDWSKQSIDMSPSLDVNYAAAADIMNYAGKFDEAIVLLKNAMRLNPYYPAMYLNGIGISYLMAGHYEEALEAYERLLNRAQRGEFPPLLAHLGLAAVYAELEKKDEARTHKIEILRINPHFSLEMAKRVRTFKSPQDSERWQSALRKAGLK